MTSLARSPTTRALHLRITPRPTSIGESREILRLISQFGEVEYFTNLKYEAIPAPNAAVVIFKQEEAAKQCLKRSPIRFRLGPAEPEQHVLETDPVPLPVTPFIDVPQPRGPSGAAFGMSQTRGLSTSSLPRSNRKPPAMPFIGNQDPPPEPVSRIFQIQANPARRQFRDAINAGHYHGSFSIDTKSAIQEDLAKRVPVLGLSCWNWKKEERPWRKVNQERKRDGADAETQRSLKELYEEWSAKP